MCLVPCESFLSAILPSILFFVLFIFSPMSGAFLYTTFPAGFLRHFVFTWCFAVTCLAISSSLPLSIIETSICICRNFSYVGQTERWVSNKWTLTQKAIHHFAACVQLNAALLVLNVGIDTFFFFFAFSIAMSLCWVWRMWRFFAGSLRVVEHFCTGSTVLRGELLFFSFADSTNQPVHGICIDKLYDKVPNFFLSVLF